MKYALKTAARLSAAMALALSGSVALAQDDAPSAPEHTAPPIATAKAGEIYGLYLSGQAAMSAGDAARASDYYGRARGADAGDVELRERALFAALASGDIGDAARLAPDAGQGRDVAQSLGRLARAVQAMSDNRGKEALKLLETPTTNMAEKETAVLLRPWAAAMSRKWDLATQAPQTKDRLFVLVAAAGQALLMEHHRRYDDAETTYKAAMNQRGGRALIAPMLGGFLERRGRTADAVALYDELLAADAGDSGLLAARARAAAKGPPPPLPSLKQGAAQALMAPASALLVARQSDAGLVYLRLVLHLDPNREDALLLLSETLSQGGDQAGARAALERISPTSGRYIAARSRLAWSYQPADKATSLKLVEAVLAERPNDTDAKIAVADILRANNRYDDAVRLVTEVIDAEGARASWRLYYLRGTSYERGGRWAEAEKDLARALSLRPDEPELLNYLGYAYIDRGQKLAEARAMIEKALAAEPRNGAYIDSLGWAYYRQGDYPKAVEQLEAAAELEPGNAEINDHLADAYWKVGRRDEARFRWASVLTLEPPKEIKAAVEAKLASPLGADAPPARTASADPSPAAVGTPPGS